MEHFELADILGDREVRPGVVVEVPDRDVCRVGDDVTQWRREGSAARAEQGPDSAARLDDRHVGVGVAVEVAERDPHAVEFLRLPGRVDGRCAECRGRSAEQDEDSAGDVANS
jgi:hypothetical protein